jgi:hypothetical protein
VYHAGEKSFSTSKAQLEEKNAAILTQRFPEYAPSVGAYAASPEYRAEHLLAGLIPDCRGKVDILFDLSNLRAVHNGTFQSMREILREAAAGWTEWCNVFILAPSDAAGFHKLDELDGVSSIRPDTDKRFAAVFHFGQPFDMAVLKTVANMGVVNCWVMLDTIAWDCQYLNEPMVEPMWRFVCSHADGILYISESVREQFHRRFAIGHDIAELALHLSLDVRDYNDGLPAAGSGGDHVLILGNHYEHKFVRQTVDAVHKALPLERLVAVGMPGHSGFNIVCYPSGQMSEREINDLFQRAKCVIYPSHSEGFGMPLIKALAFKRPVFVRDMPVMREIASKLQAMSNVHFYATTRDLVCALQDGIPIWVPMELGAQQQGWRHYAERAGEFIQQLIKRAPVGPRVAARLRALDELVAAHETVPHLEDMLHQRELQFEERQAQLQAQLEDMRRSYSWRITTPVRWLGGVALSFRGK